MIKCILISNIQDAELRLKFLQKEHTLDKMLEIARKKEDATVRSRLMSEEKVDRVRKVHERGDGRKTSKFSGRKEVQSGDANGRYKNSKDSKLKCTRCGYNKHKSSNECPANGQICGHCKNKGHFASECFFKGKTVKPKTVNLLEATENREYENDSSSTDEEDEYNVSVIHEVLHIGRNTSLMKVFTNGHKTMWQPDTGATKDIWDERYLRKIEKESGECMALERTDTKLFAYGEGK